MAGEGEHDETIVAKSAESNLKKDSAILSFFKIVQDAKW